MGMVKEITAIGQKRAQAGAKGNVDAILADVADNAVFTAARAGFRMEGKEAYRVFLINLWQNYPTRQILARQVTYPFFLGFCGPCGEIYPISPGPHPGQLN